MDLLTNAVESLQVGVEDYAAGNRPRLLSAVRNIHAGVLLLFKEALRRRSPDDSSEVLVKSRVVPEIQLDGSIRFIGTGKRTVGVREIRERFDQLGIKTDWDRFRRVSQIRNDIEHYYPSVSGDSLRELIASVFWIVRGFLIHELESDPATTLGVGTWNVMLEVAELFEAERKDCDQALAGIAWKSDTLARGATDVRCDACGSTLLKPVSATVPLQDLCFKCVACGAEKEAEDFVSAAVSQALELEAYLVYDDGGEEPYVECPECCLPTYIVEEARCAWCHAEFTPVCGRCGGFIPPSELAFSPLCSYCSYVMSKDD